MQQSTNNLHYLTNETVAASKEVSGAMDDVSGGASTLANSVDEVSEQLENMAQSVEQMNNSVGEIKGVAGKAEEASKQGLNTMRNLVRTREQSSSIVVHTEEASGKLEQKSWIDSKCCRAYKRYFGSNEFTCFKCFNRGGTCG